ncbi:phage major capsid protein [Naumannella halotolerans]|uniref:phage major capsid protein n=1 Tax=Naumannella halotolerans TaxID=993414 RepID=UPI00370D1BE5
MPYNTSDIQALVQEVVHNSLTAPLEETSSFLSLGPQIVDSATPVRFPTLSGSFAVGFVGEAEDIPVQDGPVFDDVTLMPSSMKSIKSITKISEESLRQSSQALDSILSNRLVVDVQRKLDEQLWSAEGDGVETPKGVLHPSNVTNFQTVDVAGAALSLDDLHDAVGAALSNDVPLGGLRWVLRPEQLTGLRKIKDASGQYIVNSDVTTANGYTLLGVPVQVTKRLPAGNAILLNPSSWAVVRDLSPQVQVLTELYAGSGEIGLKIGARFDAGALLPEANVLLTEIS